MNKAELVCSVQKNLGKDASKAAAEKAVNAMIESIAGALRKGKNVQLIGFGTFKVVNRKARLGDPMQVHSYSLQPVRASLKLTFKEAFSTDSDGVATCLGLQADPNMELESILKQIEGKLTGDTTFDIQ